MTVFGDPGVATTGREAGATLTLQKTADPETIVTAIAQVLDQRTGHPEGLA